MWWIVYRQLTNTPSSWSVCCEILSQLLCASTYKLLSRSVPIKNCQYVLCVFTRAKLNKRSGWLSDCKPFNNADRWSCWQNTVITWNFNLSTVSSCFIINSARPFCYHSLRFRVSKYYHGRLLALYSVRIFFDVRVNLSCSEDLTSGKVPVLFSAVFRLSVKVSSGHL